MSGPLSDEARAGVDAYLDAVEAALREAGRPREQRRAVVDDLEGQILDMVGRRSAAPTRADVDAVLAALDPPGAYAGLGGEPVTAPVAASPALVPLENIPAGVTAAPTSITQRRFLLKPAVLVTLIVCGTLLVMTPAVADHLHAQLVASIFMQRKDLSNLNFLVGEMPQIARLGFWLTGTLAIVCGVIGGFVAFVAETRARRHLS
jgi:hypothetical protein